MKLIYLLWDIFLLKLILYRHSHQVTTAVSLDRDNNKQNEPAKMFCSVCIDTKQTNYFTHMGGVN